MWALPVSASRPAPRAIQATKARTTMSTPAPTPPPPQPAPVPTGPDAGTSAQEIVIVQHSTLFYWWPVWAVGLLMALLTFIDGHRMILVPNPDDVEVRRDWTIVTGKDANDKLTTDVRQGVILLKGQLLPDKPDKPGDPLPKPYPPKLHMAASSSYGVIWAATLLLVIFITNVPLRGLWSVVVIVFIVLLAVIFALAEWWTAIFHYFSLLDIRINMGGYLFISLILLVIWLVVTLIFDKQIYMVFTPGQGKVCTEIGGGETAFDTMGMVIEKHRDDLFRHWILGLGSGDVTVKTSGANPQVFHLHNVLFMGRKLQLIEEMQRDRPVVKG
jgi:hypothetical protein